MRKSHVVGLVASLGFVACHGGEWTRPKNPEPARMPFSPSAPMPRLPQKRPPPPPAPPDALRADPAGLPPPDAETVPDRDPPAGQLGSGDER